MPTCDRITTESAVKAANAQLVVVIIPLKELVCCYALRERLANPTAHNKAGFGKQKKDLSFRPVLLSHFLLWTVQISSGTWIRTTTRGFKVLRPAIRRSPNAAPDAVRGRKRWCRGPDLNWGHRNFQSRALPTELPRRKSAQRSIHSLWRMPPQQWVPYAIGQPLYAGRAGDENRTHDLLLGKETFYR